MDRRLAPLVSILAVLSLLAYLVVIPGRLTYPFALEWQEGGMLALRRLWPSQKWACPVLW